MMKRSLEKGWKIGFDSRSAIKEFLSVLVFFNVPFSRSCTICCAASQFLCHLALFVFLEEEDKMLGIMIF